MALGRSLWLILVFAIVATLAAGCSALADARPAGESEGQRSSEVAPDTPEPLIIEQRVTPKGEEFEVRLDGNPTTGYRWMVVEIDEQRIGKISEQYIESKAGDKRVVGAGGTSVFRFKALAEGPAKIVIVYQRPWEKDADPLRIYKLELTVR